ncbi:hypothetical protein FJZ31_36360 [Candidatus Poribacteria bacterium]|nr:hypothetical protein [Candidatus Poribacteria bacterium]
MKIPDFKDKNEIATFMEAYKLRTTITKDAKIECELPSNVRLENCNNCSLFFPSSSSFSCKD